MSSPAPWLAACLLACLLLAGCATTPLPELAEPAFEMPERFVFDGEAARPNHWWLAFDDPALDRLIERALDDNFTLAAAFARVRQARAALLGERASLFPTLDGQIEQSATRRDRGGAPNFTGDSAGEALSADANRSNWSDTRTLQFAAAYEVDLWGRLRNARNAAAFELEASAADWQSAAIALAGDIASNWYQLQELEARIALLNSQIETNQNVLELTTYAFKYGQAEAVDVLRQRQAVESVRAQLEQTRASAAVTRNALAILVGVAPQQFEAPEGELVALPALPETGVPTTVLMRRPDVRQQFYSLAAADRRVAVALAERYPRLSLSATLATSSDAAALFSNWVTQLAATLSQPLFDAGAREAEILRAEGVAAEALADYQRTLLEALQETENALTNEYRQKRYIEHLDQQLALSERSVDNLRLRYLRGATDYLDVLDALLTRQNLQVDALTARRQLLDYRINLYRALAGDLELADGPGPDARPVPLRNERE